VTGLVVDASAVLAWCFEDEAGPEADALIERVAADGASVPGLWPVEIANGLVMGERRGRIKRAESVAFAAMLEDLPIVVDPQTGARALHETMSLAREHELTAYDAAYLELAMRLSLPLATGDHKLRTAAARAGVGLLSTGQSHRPA
jgi:predicted nucleic acid-binding protein